MIEINARGDVMTDGEISVWRAVYAAAWIDEVDHHRPSSDDLVADRCGVVADRAVAALRVIAKRSPVGNSPALSARQAIR
jgi:hypothetical protein